MLPPEASQFLLLVVTLSMLIAPGAAAFGAMLTKRVAAGREAATPRGAGPMAGEVGSARAAMTATATAAATVVPNYAATSSSAA